MVGQVRESTAWAVVAVAFFAFALGAGAMFRSCDRDHEQTLRACIAAGRPVLECRMLGSASMRSQ